MFVNFFNYISIKLYNLSHINISVRMNTYNSDTIRAMATKFADNRDYILLHADQVCSIKNCFFLINILKFSISIFLYLYQKVQAAPSWGESHFTAIDNDIDDYICSRC